MNNKSNYQIFIVRFNFLKGVGIKTMNLLKKKKSIIFLIYCGNYQNHIPTEAYHQKLKI